VLLLTLTLVKSSFSVIDQYGAGLRIYPSYLTGTGIELGPETGCSNNIYVYMVIK